MGADFTSFTEVILKQAAYGSSFTFTSNLIFSFFFVGCSTGLGFSGGVGKTTYIRRLITGEYQIHYLASAGITIDKLKLFTNNGPISLNFWVYSTLHSSCFHNTNAAIIILEVTDLNTYRDARRWYIRIKNECGNIPVVIIGNKMDVQEKQVKEKHITVIEKKRIQYFDVSVKCEFQLEKPLVWILQRLIGEQLHLVEEPAMIPREIELDLERASNLNRELQEAAEAKFPEYRREL